MTLSQAEIHTASVTNFDDKPTSQATQPSIKTAALGGRLHAHCWAYIAFTQR